VHILSQSVLRRKPQRKEESTALVAPLFPPEPRAPDAEEEDLEAYHCFSVAVAEAESFGDGSYVCVEDDSGLAGKAAVHLDGPHASLIMANKCDFPVLVLHLKNKRKFLSVLINIRDASGRHRKIILTNHVTQATLDAPNGSIAQLPMILAEGWQMVPVNLAELTKSLWGTEYSGIEQVRVKANCAVRKVFMADRIYADIELPEYLRALG